MTEDGDGMGECRSVLGRERTRTLFRMKRKQQKGENIIKIVQDKRELANERRHSKRLSGLVAVALRGRLWHQPELR